MQVSQTGTNHRLCLYNMPLVIAYHKIKVIDSGDGYMQGIIAVFCGDDTFCYVYPC